MINSDVVKPKSKQFGFTIVELLVVIVVIGILAAITIVSYGGVTNKANIASLQSDLTNTSQQLKLFQIDNSSYPATISTNCATNPDSLTNKCLKASEGTSYEYYVDNTASNQTFCITATKGSYSYSINNNGTTIPTAYCPVLYLDAGNSLSYPGAGNNKWYDLSGNNNNGTINGGATYSAANGGAMGFDGVDDWIDVGDDETLSLSSGNTFSMWLKGDSRFSEGATLINRRSQGNPGCYWLMVYNNKGFLQYWNGSSNINVSTTSDLPISQGVWFFYTLKISENTVSFYVNGIFIESINVANINKDKIKSHLYIGSYQQWSTNWQFDGNISNVGIYNRALSISEITQNFDTLRSRYGI